MEHWMKPATEHSRHRREERRKDSTRRTQDTNHCTASNALRQSKKLSEETLKNHSNCRMPTRDKLDLKMQTKKIKRWTINTTIFAIPNVQKVNSMSKADWSENRQAAKQSIRCAARRGIQANHHGLHEHWCGPGRGQKGRRYQPSSLDMHTNKYRRMSYTSASLWSTPPENSLKNQKTVRK